MNPQIQIPVAALKLVLQGMSKVINKRSTLPVLRCVLIESINNGVQFTGANLDDYVSRTITTQSSGEFLAAMPLESLNRIGGGPRSFHEQHDGPRFHLWSEDSLAFL
ncbi:MAG: hypothetical protein ACO1QB_07410 [Verrucomicrobiales bacterium]